MHDFNLLPLSREIHKFGLIYIARGDEKRKDALSHNVGSKEFEEFVAGLGWEVNWRDLHGFVPTIGTGLFLSEPRDGQMHS